MMPHSLIRCRKHAAYILLRAGLPHHAAHCLCAGGLNSTRPPAEGRIPCIHIHAELQQQRSSYGCKALPGVSGVQHSVAASGAPAAGLGVALPAVAAAAGFVLAAAHRDVGKLDACPAVFPDEMRLTTIAHARTHSAGQVCATVLTWLPTWLQCTCSLHACGDRHLCCDQFTRCCTSSSHVAQYAVSAAPYM